MKKRQPASRQPISYRSLNYPAPVTVAEDGEARPLSISLPPASPQDPGSEETGLKLKPS